MSEPGEPRGELGRAEGSWGEQGGAGESRGELGKKRREPEGKKGREGDSRGWVRGGTLGRIGESRAAGGSLGKSRLCLIWPRALESN